MAGGESELREEICRRSKRVARARSGEKGQSGETWSSQLVAIESSHKTQKEE